MDKPKSETQGMLPAWYSFFEIVSLTSFSDTATTGGHPNVEPSVSADPGSAPKPQQKHQGADRPAEDPEDPADPPETKDEIKHDPNDHSGEPLENRAKGGGASKSDDADDDAGGTGQSKGEGTGEKWVKSTGMAAEGGTFDAAAPGAGREADREF